MKLKQLLSGALFATLAFCQLAFIPQSASAQQRQVAPVITGFDVDQVRRPLPGTDLTFTIYGTPGADARISIAGVRNQLVLPETDPGVYAGSYTVRNGDRLDAMTTVRATLRIGRQVSSAVLNESLVAGAPWRSQPGSVPVGMAPRIQSFGVAPLNRIEPGADIDFSLTGTPGGVASVRVGGVEAPIALSEVSPGTYRGSYTIRNRDRVAPNSDVTADLRVGQRNVASTLRDPLLAVAVLPVMQPPPPPNRPPVARACLNCGVIEAINPVEQKGDGSFVGLIGGGLAGAILGNQVGKGSGRTAAQILGAVGGAYAGREIEKNVRKVTHYEVITRLETGSTQSIVLDNAPEFRVGDRVRIENNTLMPNN